MISVWEKIAEMEPEKREIFVQTAPNKKKTRISGEKAALYKRVEIIAPKDGFIWRAGPGWTDD